MPDPLGAIVIEVGDIIYDPDGEPVYECLVTQWEGQRFPIKAAHFRGLGDCADPIQDERMPKWLSDRRAVREWGTRLELGKPKEG